MPSPYLNNLIQIAKEELPLLQYDIEHASTIFTLQATCKRMHDILAYLTHHVILSDPAVAQHTRSLQPSKPIQETAEPTGHPPAQNYYPHLAPAISPIAHHVPNGNLPPIGQQIVQSSNVVEVVMTKGQTKVIPPKGIPIIAPAGVPVDTTTLGHGADVVLPQGGQMTPELMAALQNRVEPAATNITDAIPAR